MKQHIIKLSESQRQQLEQFTRTGTRSARAINRARILLMADTQGQARNDVSIADALKTAVRTVETTRQRFQTVGLEATLQRQARKDKGQPRKVDGRVQAHLTALACSSTPNGEPSWTLSMLGNAVVKLEVIESISRESVRQVLKKTRSNRT